MFLSYSGSQTGYFMFMQQLGYCLRIAPFLYWCASWDLAGAEVFLLFAAASVNFCIMYEILEVISPVSLFKRI